MSSRSPVPTGGVDVPSRSPDCGVEALLEHPLGGVHLVGLGGVGMAGLALHLQARGFAVRGSDERAGRITDWLRGEGVAVCIGHDARQVAEDARWLVRTPAVPASNPELREARRRGLPVYARGEVLPALLHGRSVAVCGTHGKTTTSAMLVHLLRAAGRDPSFLVGGEIDDRGAVAGIGQDDVIVAEADESDGTLAGYAPAITLLTGIEYDHMENFPDAEAFTRCFREVIARTRGRLVYGRDDARARELAVEGPRPLSYGFGKQADIAAEAMELVPRGASFRLRCYGEDRGPCRLPVPGRHNIANALGAIACGLELGLDPDIMRQALADYRPVRRRFEWVRDDVDLAVVSDYAHHPTEIRAAVAAARGVGRPRLVAVFQPHRFTRTRALGPDFPPAFQGVDRLVLAPVYPASEPPLAGGTSEDLAAHFRARGFAGLVLAADLEDAANKIWSSLRRGDMLLIVGAGDVNALAARLSQWPDRAHARR